MIILKQKVLLIPKNKNPSKITSENIAEHNILENYNYNLNLLREYKEKNRHWYFTF